ncbi:MAG: acyl-ACP--UDP-N-acetylglucosamine O-acyltransferase [Arenimonas sp.]|nr:acyl-ACP--UDP-N-acetylglucosamine O-acyltransferase [Arenimonas sp.]MBP6309916.1 acyl-ACP--UDP-N-acetylglucosamine O-acyltransferase [Arenimonas sp.]
MIHSTAIIDPSATLHASVKIGPYTIIGADVVIGENSEIGAHCVITGPCSIGKNNKVYSHAALGGDPQDKKFHGEHCSLEIGDNNVIREFTTFNRGTEDGGGITKIGNDNWIMAYVHIAHDCIVGNHTIFANNASLAGHAIVEDWVIFAGFSGAHQFCKIGAHAFIGMGSLVDADVPPFVVTGMQYAVPRAINAEGLKRRGFSLDRIKQIKQAYRTVYMSGKTLADAKIELAESAMESEDVKLMLDFIEASKRGIVR